MKSWQKIAIAFVALTVAAVIFMYSRSASAANVSVLTNKVSVAPSTGPKYETRRGVGAF